MQKAFHLMLLKGRYYKCIKSHVMHSHVTFAQARSGLFTAFLPRPQKKANFCRIHCIGLFKD